jgi:hypothetical protein
MKVFLQCVIVYLAAWYGGTTALEQFTKHWEAQHTIIVMPQQDTKYLVKDMEAERAHKHMLDTAAKGNSK